MKQKMNQQKVKEKMMKKQRKEEKKKAKIAKKENKEEKKINLNYWDKKWYKALGDILIVVNLMIAVLSLYIAVLVRQDTEELTKMADKDLYYTIRLYPTENTKEYKEYENYIRLPLQLVVDDFKIEKKDFLNVNYNSTFSRIKYFMVYDYNQKTKEYHYFVTGADDKTQAQMRLEEQYDMYVTEMNYSLTPNKQFAYVLIYTESTERQNLDLIFFSYKDAGDSFNLEVEENENGDIEVAHHRIDKDAFICREYFTNLWGENEIQKEDIEFMFDVYKDLEEKMKLN